jgi:putative ABC transport system permease protein
MAVLGALGAAGGSLIKVHRLPILDSAQPFAWQEAQQRWLRRQAAVAALCFGAAAGAYALGTGLIAGFVMMGGLLLGAALGLPIVLSAALRLGERSADHPIAKWFWADSRQQLSGLSLALMALLLALAANIGVGMMVEGFRKTFTAWLDRRLVAEVYVDAKGNEQGARLARWLEGRADVDAVLQVWRAETRIAGWPADVYGSRDHTTYRQNWALISALPNAWDRVHAGGAALVSEQTARRLGLATGATLHIPTPNGDWPVEVAGIYADYGNPKGQIAVNVAALSRRFPATPLTRMAVRTDPANIPGLMAALSSQFGLDGRNLVDQATVKRESKQIFNRTFAVTGALNAFTLGVAGVALLTSLLTLANSRLPQLAPLWAIGLTRRQLAGIELLKTLAVAAITALLALPLGLLVAWCLIAIVNVKAFGWRLPFDVFPLQLIRLLLVTLLAALLASLLPVLRLARMQPANLVRIFTIER